MKIVKKIVKNILKVIHIFPIDDKKIFLMSFNGTAVGFDSKAIYEYAKDKKMDYKFFWGTSKNFQRKLSLGDVKFVELKSLRGLYEMMTARTIIYNINAPSYIPFRKKQILINTWHGLGIKNAGKNIENFSKEQFNLTTCFLSHAEKYTEIVIKDSFEYEGEILCSGVPRNDVFFNNEKTKKLCEKVKKAYNIRNEEKVLLYAPTFRNDFEFKNVKLDLERIKNELEKKSNEKWIILFRAHPMIAEAIKYPNAINVSSYQDTQELLCVADVLITDYSSTSWDFSLMKKPVFVFAPDIEEYKKNRGLNEFYNLLPYSISKNNDELIKQISKFDENLYQKKLEHYFNKVGNYERGNSCKMVFDYIEKKIINEKK